MSGRQHQVKQGFGRRLKRLRLAKGLTQKEVAEPHYSAAYVSTIEAGRRMPSRAALEHFAVRLGMEADELITGRPSDLLPQLTLELQEARVAISAGRYREAEEQLGKVKKAAARYGLRRIEARVEEGLGLAAERRGAVSRALEHFERAEGLLSHEPVPLRAEAVAGVARCTQMMGDLRYAIHILETYLMLLERSGLRDPVALMRTYSALVWPYSEAELLDKAAEAAAHALKLEPRVHDQEQVANMHINVARALLQQGYADDALKSLEKAEELYRSLDWKTEIARAHLARGIVLSQRGELEEARRELTSSLGALQGTSSHLNEARALNELAKVERLAGRLEEAERLLERSLSLLRDGDVAELALAHRELGLCQTPAHHDLAEKNLRIAIDLYRRAEQPLEVAASFRALGDLLVAQGDLDAARETYREGIFALEERP